MHTPGPWEVKQDSFVATNSPHTGTEYIGLYVDAEDELICDRKIYKKMTANEYARAEANARLIAAAPEMLDALKRARAWMDDRRAIAEYVEEIALVDDALAKAEGRTP